MHVLFLLAVVGVASDQSDTKGEPPYIWEVVDVASKAPVVRTFQKRGEMYYKLRTKENCKFPLDVLILQDTTESFQDNIDAMRDTQIDLIYNGISGAHPDSRFGVASFKDKPISPLGNRDDYCAHFDAPLGSSLDEIKSAYQKLVAYGGADAPENQFGILYNALSGKAANWSEDSAATKLIVISTDAGPHFEGDSRTGMLPPFDPNAANDDDMAVCTARYYPSAEQVRALIGESGAYVASLVYDGEWAKGWPSKSWVTFNEFIGQRKDFVAPQAPDSSDFWDHLANIVAVVEDEECSKPTPAPTTTEEPRETTMVPPPPSTKTEASWSVVPPPPSTKTEASWSVVPPPPSTKTEASWSVVPPAPSPPTEASSSVVPPAPTTQSECPQCPCDGCQCCPEVAIHLQHRPKSLHLDVENSS